MTEERFQLWTSEADVLWEQSHYSGTLHVLDVQLPTVWGRHIQKLSGEQVMKIFHISYGTKASCLCSHNFGAAFFLILLL
jgi:hypothetical protein